MKIHPTAQLIKEQRKNYVAKPYPFFKHLLQSHTPLTLRLFNLQYEEHQGDEIFIFTNSEWMREVEDSYDLFL